VNQKEAKRLRRFVRVDLGLHDDRNDRRYRVLNPRYVRRFDPSLLEIVDELYTCTLRAQPNSPRDVYRALKREIKKGLARI